VGSTPTRSISFNLVNYGIVFEFIVRYCRTKMLEMLTLEVF
jgi:hypothetical protein